jgi:type IV pilus assembly protein PilF
LALNYDPARSVSLLELAKLNLQTKNAVKADHYFQRYRKSAPATAASLWVGIQIAAKLGKSDALASYSLMLKNTFPKSQEYKKFQESHLYDTAG